MVTDNELEAFKATGGSGFFYWQTKSEKEQKKLKLENEKMRIENERIKLLIEAKKLGLNPKKEIKVEEQKKIDNPFMRLLGLSKWRE